MNQNKKTYTKPTIVFHQEESAKYQYLKMLLDEKMLEGKNTIVSKYNRQIR